jgi:multidrug efflux system outer membrane protein
LKKPKARSAATAATRREAARLARVRYGAVVSDFSVVLDAEREALTSQDTLMRAQTATASALVAVYRALGGGWVADVTGAKEVAMSAPSQN